MTTPSPYTDLLLEGVQHPLPRRLVDAPRVDTSREASTGFDWKPTILLVALGAGALAAFTVL